MERRLGVGPCWVPLYGAPPVSGATAHLVGEFDAQRREMNEHPEAASWYRSVSARRSLCVCVSVCARLRSCGDSTCSFPLYAAADRGSMLVSLRVDFNQKFSRPGVPHTHKPPPKPVSDKTLLRQMQR